MSEAAVTDAVLREHQMWTDCLSRLPNCDAVAASTQYATGALSDARYVQATGLNEAGNTATNLESRTITVESAQLDPTANTATVVTCENDGAVLLGPDGAVVNDAYVSRRVSYTLVLEGGQWRASDRAELARADGEGNGLCVAAG